MAATQSTVFRFGPCELDEARRSLRAHGKEIKLQPRVFDLLCYLVRHRERVVGKEELLDALWPGTIVVDNALQRIVSLARAALANVGLDNAVRTYSRHGYRFCHEDCADDQADEAAPAPDVVSASEGAPSANQPLCAAREALERNDWAAACQSYAAADAVAPLSCEDVEQWARAAISAGEGPSVVAVLERTVAQRDAAGDPLGAVRATVLLVQIRIDSKQAVIARGLLQRASRYLEGYTNVAERGHYAWMASRMALGGGDAALALAMADEACAIGRSLRNADLECLGLAYRGHALMAQGDVARGLSEQEEAAALIGLGGVRGWVAGWVLCSILYAARHRCDWLRAAQFTEAYLEWSRSCSMPAFPGTCRLHRAAVLGVQGALEHAAKEVRAAATLLANIAPWAEGDAFCVLGDIQVSHGDFAGAEASFRQAHALGWDPQPGLARLHLMTGRYELARRGLESALEAADWTLRERRGQLLCLLVHAAIGSGDAERAREAVKVLQSDPQMLNTEALKAMHCEAVAALALHDGDVKLAIQRLRQAVRRWRETGSPVGEAEARIRLAECLVTDRDASGTEMELHAIDSHLSTLAVAHEKRLTLVREAMLALG